VGVEVKSVNFVSGNGESAAQRKMRRDSDFEAAKLRKPRAASRKSLKDKASR